MDVRGKKVYVGLSGGVDSAVSAALLQKAGAEVTGVFIKGWYPPGMPCTWAADRRDAMRVAATLHIPFITLDASAEYKRAVIDYLVREYKEGRTPNPDIMCNREIKFGVFYAFAKAQGADYLATGHYRAGEKDQSYFLWAVPKEALEKTLFPVGNLSKDYVRTLAKSFRLPVADKKDSQGVCFLGSISVEEFLRKELGTSNPAILHTLGERYAEKGGGPWYISSKDVEKGTVELTKDPPQGGLNPIRFTNPNWLQEETPSEAAIRYRGSKFKGKVERDRFIPTESVSDLPVPGQSIVFFHEDKLVGGGIISE